MQTFPTPESSGEIVLDWLHEEGWSVSNSRQSGIWHVEAAKGNTSVKTSGTTLEEALYRATEQARMSDSSFHDPFRLLRPSIKKQIQSVQV